jgi:hypothetical protein
MKLIETPWWSLPISDEWQTETDEDTIIIFDQDGVGSLEFSVLEFDEGDVTADDLQEVALHIIAAGIEGVAAECGVWRGLRFEYVNDDYFCRDWLLRYQQKILVISYTCDLEDRGLDDAAVDQMLGDLRGYAEA